MRPIPSLRRYVEYFGIVRGFYEWFLELCAWFILLPFVVIGPPLRILASAAFAVMIWTFVALVVSTLFYVLW